jgi:hypothetical protein
MLKDRLFEPYVMQRGENHLQIHAVQPTKIPSHEHPLAENIARPTLRSFLY